MFESSQTFDQSGTSAAAYFDGLVPKFSKTTQVSESWSVSNLSVIGVSEQYLPDRVVTQIDLTGTGHLYFASADHSQIIAVVMEQLAGTAHAVVGSIGSWRIMPGQLALAVSDIGHQLSFRADDVALLRVLVVQGSEGRILPAQQAGFCLLPQKLSAEVRQVELAWERGSRIEDLLLALLAGTSKVPRIGDDPPPGGLAPWQLMKVHRYVVEHLARPLPLKELAGLVRLSQSHFCRAFKISAGLPPHQWMLMLRCQRAKELMVQGRMSLVQIALEVGFGDQSHFTWAFSRVFGSPPGTWRRRHLSVPGGRHVQ